MPLKPILERARTVAADFNPFPLPEVHFPPSPGGLTRTFADYSSTLYDRRPTNVVRNDTRLTTRSGKPRTFAALLAGHDHDDLPKESQTPPPLWLVPDLSSESDERDGFVSSPTHMGLVSQTSTVAGANSPHQIPSTVSLAANTASDVLPEMQAELNPDIVLDEPSPEARKSVNPSLESPDAHRDNTLTPITSVPNAVLQHLQRQHGREQSMHFPRFVHSHPDRGISLTDRLRKQQHNLNYSFGSSLSFAGYGLSSPGSGTGSTIDSFARHALLDEPSEDPHVHSYVKDLLTTWERRAPLLSMLMTDSNQEGDELRKKLEIIETQIGEELTLILKSGDARREARQLTGSNAQSLIDAIQDVLSRGTLPDASLRSKARKLLLKVSVAREQLPSSLFITGVNDHDKDPTFGGGFGDVYRASYQGHIVALKRIRIFTADSSTRRNRLQFYKEALVWQGLRHPFILPLLGIDRSTFAPSFCMVSPWMKHGTVLKYLQDRGRREVNRLLLEVAQGLGYLHSMKIVHGDLRGNNILISDDGNACLSDFGLATTITDIDSTTGVASSSNRAGSIRWFAPELIEPKSFGCEKFLRTTASDVYAYACVCLELYTGSPPFAKLAEVAALMKVIANERPEQPTAIPAALWQLVSAAALSSGTPLKESLKNASVQISTANANGELYVWGYVPVIIAKCGLYLKENATEVPGTFRIQGSTRQLHTLQAIFELPPRYGKSLDWKEESFTTHDVANVFRRFLTRLPESVIPSATYHVIRDAIKGQSFNHDEVIAMSKRAFRAMPRANQYLLLYVLDLLSVFARKSDKNLMTAAELAVIFEPGLISNPAHEMHPAERTQRQQVLAFLIAQQDWFMLDIPPPPTPPEKSESAEWDDILGDDEHSDTGDAWNLVSETQTPETARRNTIETVKGDLAVKSPNDRLLSLTRRRTLLATPNEKDILPSVRGATSVADIVLPPTDRVPAPKKADKSHLPPKQEVRQLPRSIELLSLSDDAFQPLDYYGANGAFALPLKIETETVAPGVHGESGGRLQALDRPETRLPRSGDREARQSMDCAIRSSERELTDMSNIPSTVDGSANLVYNNSLATQVEIDYVDRHIERITVSDSALNLAADTAREVSSTIQAEIVDVGHIERAVSLPASSSESQSEASKTPEDRHAQGYVNNLLATWERRKPLLSMLIVAGSDRQGLSSHELRKDLDNIESQIGRFLTHILESQDATRAARQLEGNDALSLIDAIQDVLDRGTLPDAPLRSKARKLLQKVSEAQERLPTSLFIAGVTDHDEHPTFSGGFGDVYRASYQKRMVALKRIRIFTADFNTHRNRLQFCKEALVWQGLRHSFILPLLGIDRSTFAPSYCMVSPWMKHGTALKYLQNRGRGDVNRLLLEIAQGLDYLHSLNIVHGDLRGNNILISDDGNACLSDFGLATTISDPDSTVGMLSSSTNHGGSARWFAPELIDPKSFGCEKFLRTTASDVYAYACVCVELYTGSPPFAKLLDVVVMFKVIAHERPEQPPAMSAALWQLVTTAWASDFRNRPSIHGIAVGLEAMFSTSQV
ncbi:Rho GTPase activator [Mycena sanguinolenta]|uniref:Rho GTPase activator n=1 Tax=Mycena sanguinolenta TaxID=230812 RepID=A0A8H7CH22_9AGAR|nr:Rho GTPase activator [Mycena sanguinolenta]